MIYDFTIVRLKEYVIAKIKGHRVISGKSYRDDRYDWSERSLRYIPLRGTLSDLIVGHRVIPEESYRDDHLIVSDQFCGITMTRKLMMDDLLLND